MKHDGKWLSYVLRHNPGEVGASFDAEGWVNIADVVASGRLSEAELLAIVAADAKGRFTLDASQESVRARYGHSTEGEIKYPNSDAQRLCHGTQARFLATIRAQGLVPMSRQYVHLTTDPAMATVVGKRRGKDLVILEIDVAGLRAAGFPLYDAGRDVVLTTSVPPEFLRFPA